MNINNVFWTLQGEGLYAGTRALFVRMPFCNLSCSWCDTEFNTFTKWSEEEFSAFATSEPGRFAVVTGGEPMMNKHTPDVLKLLKTLGFFIACETNGTFPALDNLDFITCSPKRDAQYQVHEQIWDKVSEFKYVVDTDFDFAILDRHNLDDGKRYSLSPEFNNMPESVSKIISYIKENPKWKLSLQTHKWINIP